MRIKHFLLIAALLIGGDAHANIFGPPGVTQSGVVSSGDCAVWNGNNSIKAGPCGGGQTPWTSNINGAGFHLYNATIYDNAGTPKLSIDPINRILYAPDGVTKLINYNGVGFDSNSNISFINADTYGSVFFRDHILSSDGGGAIDPNTRTLTLGNGDGTVDWANMALKNDDIGTILDWSGIYNSDAPQSFDGNNVVFKNNITLGYGGNLNLTALGGGEINMPSGTSISDGSLRSIDPYNRQLFASDGTTVAIDWSSATTVAMENMSLDMGITGAVATPTLYTNTIQDLPGDGTVIDVLNSQIFDNTTNFSGALSVDFGNRQLIAPDGTTIVINYNSLAAAKSSLGIGTAGSFSGTGTATTSFVVTIGATQPNTSYKVVVEPTNVLSTAVQYISAKTTTTFTVTYLAGLTGAVAFDWILSP